MENMNQKQHNIIFIHKELAVKVIMDCRITAAHKFRTRLGFKQYDVILTKEDEISADENKKFVWRTKHTNKI